MGTLPLSIAQAKAVLSAHGFRVHTWARSYRVTRDLPAYGSQAAPFQFHRNHRGFSASEVTLSAVRRLAAALLLADSHQVTSKACADAWAADRRAELAWEEAGVLQRDANSWRRPDFTIEQLLSLGVAEIKAAGAAQMAQLTRQVLLEGWQEANPLAPVLARMGSDKAAY
jgi:hypothetical protein